MKESQLIGNILLDEDNEHNPNPNPSVVGRGGSGTNVVGGSGTGVSAGNEEQYQQYMAQGMPPLHRPQSAPPALPFPSDENPQEDPQHSASSGSDLAEMLEDIRDISPHDPRLDPGYYQFYYSHRPLDHRLPPPFTYWQMQQLRRMMVVPPNVVAFQPPGGGMGRGGGYGGGPGKDEQHIPKENELVDSVASANHGTPSHSFSTPSHHPHYPSNGGQPDDGWGNSEHLAGGPGYDETSGGEPYEGGGSSGGGGSFEASRNSKSARNYDPSGGTSPRNFGGMYEGVGGGNPSSKSGGHVSSNTREVTGGGNSEEAHFNQQQMPRSTKSWDHPPTRGMGGGHGGTPNSVPPNYSRMMAQQMPPGQQMAPPFVHPLQAPPHSQEGPMGQPNMPPYFGPGDLAPAMDRLVLYDESSEPRHPMPMGMGVYPPQRDQQRLVHSDMHPESYPHVHPPPPFPYRMPPSMFPPQMMGMPPYSQMPRAMNQGEMGAGGGGKWEMGPHPHPPQPHAHHPPSSGQQQQGGTHPSKMYKPGGGGNGGGGPPSSGNVSGGGGGDRISSSFPPNTSPLHPPSSQGGPISHGNHSRAISDQSMIIGSTSGGSLATPMSRSVPSNMGSVSPNPNLGAANAVVSAPPPVHSLTVTPPSSDERDHPVGNGGHGGGSEVRAISPAPPPQSQSLASLTSSSSPSAGHPTKHNSHSPGETYLSSPHFDPEGPTGGLEQESEVRMTSIDQQRYFSSHYLSVEDPPASSGGMLEWTSSSNTYGSTQPKMDDDSSPYAPDPLTNVDQGVEAFFSHQYYEGGLEPRGSLHASDLSIQNPLVNGSGVGMPKVHSGRVPGSRGRSNYPSMTDSSDERPMEKPQPSPLLEEFRNNKNRKFTLQDIKGYVVEFSRDQYGSRFIQQKLEEATPEESQMIFEEIRPQAFRLMVDVFGNYVIQKFFEHGTREQIDVLGQALFGHVLFLSLQIYGCRVIQKALEVISVEQKSVLVSELVGSVMKCVKDQNGNHVIQKCIECVPPNLIQFIVDGFAGKVCSLASHPYGCRVIQRILEHCISPETQTPILVELLRFTVNLVQDQYGNYVIQHVLVNGRPEHKLTIVQMLEGEYLELSKNKFGSNVVEKCVQYSGDKERDMIIREIVGTEDDCSPLQSMMRDQFGNYVIQKVLDHVDETRRQFIVRLIKQHIPQMRKFTYSKHIIARVEKEDRRVSGMGSGRRSNPHHHGHHSSHHHSGHHSAHHPSHHSHHGGGSGGVSQQHHPGTHSAHVSHGHGNHPASAHVHSQQHPAIPRSGGGHKTAHSNVH